MKKTFDDFDLQLKDFFKKNPFFLAPMAGITDSCFRIFMRHMGAGILTSELVSAVGLKYQSKKTIEYIDFFLEEKPIGIQLFGNDSDVLLEAALMIESKGIDFIDLNFACPVKKVVKRGSGAAVLKDLQNLKLIIQKLKNSIKIPISIKIRTGWDEKNKVADEICHIAYNEGVSWVSLHGRTAVQSYRGKADWEYIKSVKEKSKVPLIGNGDIVDAKMAINYLNQNYCDGIMIGRGALKNPWIFQECKNLLEKQKIELKSQDEDLNATMNNNRKEIKNLKEVIDKLYFLYNKKYGNTKIVLIKLQKMANWFSHGISDSKFLRQKIYQQKNVHDLLAVIKEFN